jgi:hypothetical protein
VSIGILLATIILAGLTVILLLIAAYSTYLYMEIGEPIIIHFTSISFLLFFAFLTSAIGIGFELDQDTHPIYLVNFMIITLTYVEIGFIYKSLNTNRHPILSNYLILILVIAPAYVFSRILNADTTALIFMLTQLIPLITVFLIDHKILSDIFTAQAHFTNNSDISILKGFQLIFNIARFIHGVGIIVILTITILHSLDTDYEVTSIWGEEWIWFDYVYLILAFIVFALFIRFILKLKILISHIKVANMTDIMNSLMN